MRRKTDPAGLVTLRDPQSAGADAFRRLRSNLTFETDEAHMGSVLVTGVDVDRGSTWVATNLAVALSAIGRRVVLVSADLQRSNLRATFEVETAAGLADVLRQTADVREAIGPAPVAGLSLIDGRSGTGEAAATGTSDDLLDPVKARRIIARASLKEGAVTVVEAPPIATCVDTAAWASACDGVVLVCDIKSTRRAELVAARQQCERARASVLGAVLLERTRAAVPPGGVRRLFARRSPATPQEPAMVAITELGSTGS